MIIYKITNKVNNKIYIGQTIRPIQERWYSHTNGWSGCLALANAIEKYGKDNFTIEQIDTADTLDELNKKEIDYIKDYNSLAPNGYNLMSGGNNSKHSIKSIEKMRKSSKGQVAWNKGLTKDDPRVAKYVRRGEDNFRYGKVGTRKGVKLSKETKEKISKVQIGKKASNKTKEKMSKSHKKHTIICVNTGKEYQSITEASKDLNLNSGNVQGVLKGRTKKTGGYSFRYKELNND